MESTPELAQVSCGIEHPGGSVGLAVLVLRLGGRWKLAMDRPVADAVLSDPSFRDCARLRFEFDALESWDSALLIFLRACLDWAERHGIESDLRELPEGVRDLIQLSQAVAGAPATNGAPEPDWLSAVGIRAIKAGEGIDGYAAFIGELLLDLLALLRGRARVRKLDLLQILQSAGPLALPIVALLSFLTGLIIAFIGVIQLQKFAADIYVADLVGLATTRELGAVMAGVIMAGRTGAAFAAQIGSMRVNDEIDALSTFGISPMQFLVLPRVIALVLMMPLLCGFANLVSIAGGMVVAVGISDVSVTQYVHQIHAAVGLADLLVGIFKSAVFGVIIAIAGCYRGLHCGKDATAVGLAATSAVVTSITWIVVADAVFAVLFQLLGI